MIEDRRPRPPSERIMGSPFGGPASSVPAVPRTPAPPEGTAQPVRLAAALRMAEEADKKAAQAEADREEKRKPYEADPLFMYLWRRRFGTAEYRANRLARYLDRKVARLIGYDKARANYAMLNELPVRLREHAERLKAEAAALGAKGP